MASNAPRDDGAPPPVPPQNPPPLRKYMKILGASMITVGALSVVISGVLVSLNDLFVTDYAGSGIWCGLFFFATGVCALNTFSATVYMAVATIVTSIASMLLAITMIGVISTSVARQINGDIYVGFKAGEGLLILFGLAEIVLSAFCMFVGSRFLLQSRRENQANDGSPLRVAPEDSSPFPTAQHKDTVKWMGIWQAFVGLASILDTSITLSQDRYVSDGAVGIWCGIIFLATGILNFWAAAARKKGWIIAAAVMSVFCVPLVITMMVWAALIIPRVGSCYTNNCRWKSGMATAYGLLIALSLAELIMSLWCAVFCFKTICGPACCFPQVVLHIQDGNNELQAAQGGYRLQPVPTTADHYKVGSQIHVQIRLAIDRVQNENQQVRRAGESNDPS